MDRSASANCRRGLPTSVEVGKALPMIRDATLYLKTHKTFEAYCRERWRMSKRHANRLVQSAEVVVNLGPIGPNVGIYAEYGDSTPQSESVIRPLTRLPKSEQKEAWSEAGRG